MPRPPHTQAHNARAHYARPRPKDPTPQSGIHYYVVMGRRVSLDRSTERVYSSSHRTASTGSTASTNGDTASSKRSIKKLAAPRLVGTAPRMGYEQTERDVVQRSEIAAPMPRKHTPPPSFMGGCRNRPSRNMPTAVDALEAKAYQRPTASTPQGMPERFQPESAASSHKEHSMFHVPAHKNTTTPPAQNTLRNSK